ncbi:P-loop containing nucleoside triphosphate hydrolase protein [Cladochytrium replicatum]|nr:P-loop containing nucleoside triphosphate hydrolase protein [Cladochytrium replicatum]
MAPSLTRAEAALSASEYNAHARKVLRLVSRLRDAGAHFDLDLPTIVVAGSQSAGKSSLIEAISGITLPRAEGTCTRCVTEVRLTEPESLVTLPSSRLRDDEDPSRSWGCTVKLRYEYETNGRPLGKPREVIFARDVRDKGDLESYVRRAQKALLNPSQDAAKYIEYRFDDSNTGRDREAKSNELKFSRNVVCLDIRNAGVNLNLIDLPGIIRSMDSRDDLAYIDMIETLVKEYIRKDKSIIVATITCKDEIDNQAIVTWAKEVDPYGVRSLAVLTKPDTIERATHDRWVSIMMGQHYSLKLGYWMVKNPSKAELDEHISPEDARRREMDFFNSTKPWADLRAQSDRFGVDVLRRELSRQLTLLTDHSLPEIKAKAEKAMQATVADLQKLPPSVSPENARIELLQMVRHFSTLVNQNISAQQDFKVFFQRVRAHFDEFMEAVSTTRPVFLLDRKSSAPKEIATASPSTQHATLSLSLPSLLPSFLTSSTDEKKKLAEKAAAAAAEKEKEKSPTPPPTTPGATTYSLNGNILTDGEKLLDVTKPISFMDIRRVIDGQKGRELHGYSPYGAFAFVVNSFQEEWNKYAINCLAAVSNELHLLIAKVTDEVFGRFVNLTGQMRFIIQVFQSELYRHTLEMLNHAASMERRNPFTMASDEFVRLKTSALNDFKALFLQSSANNPALSGFGTPTTPTISAPQAQQLARGGESVNRALAALAEAGFTGLTGRDLLRLKDSGGSEVDEVLNVMAAADAYFTLAFKRFSDVVPMTIDYHFLAKFGQNLEKEVVERIGLLEKDSAAIALLLEEDRAVAERRRALEDQRSRLDLVWRNLYEYR